MSGYDELIERLRGPYDSERQLAKRCLVAATALEAAGAYARDLEKALMKLAAFDFSSAEKIQIAREALASLHRDRAGTYSASNQKDQHEPLRHQERRIKDPE